MDSPFEMPLWQAAEFSKIKRALKVSFKARHFFFLDFPDLLMQSR